jgi:ADP-heptose:LPS heptosyltransferase
MPYSNNADDIVEKINGFPEIPLTRWQPSSEALPILKRSYLLKLTDRYTVLQYLFPVISLAKRIHLLQIGWLKNPIGRPVLSGIVAVRVLIYTTKSLTSATLTLDDDPTVLAQSNPVFMTNYKGVGVWSANIWLDSATIPAGVHKLRIHAYSGTTRVARMRRFVGKLSQQALLEKVGEDAAQSDSFVPSPLGTQARKQNPMDSVLDRPVAVHYPRDSLFARPIKSILILRTDQLGDVSASLPAMARLRKMFPDAVISVLSQKFVQTMIEGSGIADEFLTISLSYSHESERRFLSAESESQIRATLHGRSFDLAIDLSPGEESQPLMLLCDAHYRVGFKPERFSFIDFGIEVTSRDKINSKSIINHAAHIMMLIQALETAMKQIEPSVPRVADAHGIAVFQEYNVTKGQYAVVHSGARHPINQWSMENFIAVARHLAKHEDMPVLFFIDKPLSHDEKNLCVGIENLTILEKLPPSSFDILISNARLFVGNDTGPKHLAATRGVPFIVSISIPRLNWQEWGQNRGGVIVTRQVPCAGCGINNLAQCGKDAVCIRTIPAEDVISIIGTVLHEIPSSQHYNTGDLPIKTLHIKNKNGSVI